MMDPAGYTWKELLLYGGGASAVLVALALIAGRLLRRKEDRHIQVVTCEDCGWRGQVSRYAGRCPGCNNPLGDEKAKRG